MGYEEVQKLHKKELLAMGISQDEAKEIMTAEEEYGVSFRDTWELELTIRQLSGRCLMMTRTVVLIMKGSEDHEETEVQAAQLCVL